jgi:hypothetical protein
LHLFGPGVQLIGGEHLSVSEEWVDQGFSQSEMDAYLKGFIGVRYELSFLGTNLYSRFMSRWRARQNTDGTFRSDSPSICAGINFKAYSPSDVSVAANAYDAVYAVALGIQGLLDANERVNGSSLHDYILNSLRFDGITGEVAFHRGYGELNFDSGGRGGDITYRVVNYQKVWRVHAVSSSMTRTVIGMRSVIWRFCVILGIIVLLLSVIQGFGVPVKIRTITRTQLSYTREYYCDYMSEPVPYILCLCVQALVLLVGAYYCYRTRKVDAVLSDTAAIMEGEYMLHLFYIMLYYLAVKRFP